MSSAPYCCACKRRLEGSFGYCAECRAALRQVRQRRVELGLEETDMRPEAVRAAMVEAHCLRIERENPERGKTWR
jgi:hypothetical protein